MKHAFVALAAVSVLGLATPDAAFAEEGRIYVMRHGDAAQYFGTWRDWAVGEKARAWRCRHEPGAGQYRLTTTGVERAKKVGASLKARNVEFVAAFASEKCRAADTAYFVSGLTPDTDHKSGELTPKQIEALLTRVKAAAADGHVLLVIHSEQVDPVVQALASPATWPKTLACFGQVRVFEKAETGWALSAVLPHPLDSDESDCITRVAH